MSIGAVGGFAQCAHCRQHLWIDDEQGRCAQCRAEAERPSVVVAGPEPEPEPVTVVEPPPEPAAAEPGPEPAPKPGKLAKRLRKTVERRYDEGKFAAKVGDKPNRARLDRYARRVWDGLSPAERDQLLADLRDAGFSASEPADAVADFCERVAKRRRATLNNQAHPATVESS